MLIYTDLFPPIFNLFLLYIIWWLFLRFQKHCIKMVVKGQGELMARETMIPERISVLKCYDYIFKTNKSSVWFLFYFSSRVRTFITSVLSSCVAQCFQSSVRTVLLFVVILVKSLTVMGKYFTVKHQVVLNLSILFLNLILQYFVFSGFFFL